MEISRGFSKLMHLCVDQSSKYEHITHYTTDYSNHTHTALGDDAKNDAYMISTGVQGPSRSRTTSHKAECGYKDEKVCLHQGT